jgi:ABC-2 type transport system permease protein
MATHDHPKPSFSPGRKWSIGLNVVLLTIFVFAVVVMVNYLSRDYSYRLNVGVRARLRLSPYTLGLLKSITNQVSVVLYYNKYNALYDTVADLLNEYHLANPRIKIRKVDYLKDPSAANEIQNTYKLGSKGDKNLVNKDLVIFDCEGRPPIVVPGQFLTKYVQEQLPDEKEIRILRVPVAFRGETVFDAALINVVNPRPLKAYFLTFDGEGQISSPDGLDGYSKLAELLAKQGILPMELSLLGTNPVPADCNLLVIAAPKLVMSAPELKKIQQYLTEGGRLLALFHFAGHHPDIGLEKLLALWGVEVGDNVVRDPDNSVSSGDVVITDAGFSDKHMITASFVGSGSRLQMYQPRTVGRLKSRAPEADAPTVEELVFTGPRAQVFVNNQEAGGPQKVPLMVAVEKGAIRDVKNERGTTRMVIAGDAVFLANSPLEGVAGNHQFAEAAINWLVERPELVQGPGPQPVHVYRLLMTNSQLRNAELVLLVVFPGAVLFLGVLVWLRRRR